MKYEYKKLLFDIAHLENLLATQIILQDKKTGDIVHFAGHIEKSKVPKRVWGVLGDISRQSDFELKYFRVNSGDFFTLGSENLSISSEDLCLKQL